MKADFSHLSQLTIYFKHKPLWKLGTDLFGLFGQQGIFIYIDVFCAIVLALFWPMAGLAATKADKHLTWAITAFTVRASHGA